MGLVYGCLGIRSAGGVNAIVCWITRPQFLHTNSPVVWSCRWFVVLHSGQGFVSHKGVHLQWSWGFVLLGVFLMEGCLIVFCQIFFVSFFRHIFYLRACRRCCLPYKSEKRTLLKPKKIISLSETDPLPY
jgi:hypothetical protein